MPNLILRITLPALLLAGCGDGLIPPENPGPPPPIAQMRDDDLHPPPGPTDPFMIRVDDRALGAWADYCTRIKDLAGPNRPPSAEKTRIEGDLRKCEEIFSQ